MSLDTEVNIVIVLDTINSDRCYAQGPESRSNNTIVDFVGVVVTKRHGHKARERLWHCRHQSFTNSLVMELVQTPQGSAVHLDGLSLTHPEA